MNLFKRILAVLSGVVTASLIIFLMEEILQKLYPLPPGLNMNSSHEKLIEHMNTMPVVAFILLTIGYAIGSFAGGIASTFASGRLTMRASLITGALLTVAGLFNPNPMWYAVANSLVYVPSAYLGYIIVRKKN